MNNNNSNKANYKRKSDGEGIDGSRGRFHKKRDHNRSHGGTGSERPAKKKLYGAGDSYVQFTLELSINVHHVVKDNRNLKDCLDDILAGKYNQFVQPVFTFTENTVENALLKFYEEDKRGALNMVKEHRSCSEEEAIAIIQSEYDKMSRDKRVATIEDKLFYDEMRRFYEKKLSYESDKLYICAEIKKMLKPEFLSMLSTFVGATDTYDGIKKIKEGWMNDPLKLLDNVKKTMSGENLAMDRTAEELAELKVTLVHAFNTAAQRESQSLSEYIIYFDKVVNNLKHCYGSNFAQVFDDALVVVRFISSLKNKGIEAYYKANSRLGTSVWPKDYEQAKTKVRTMEPEKYKKHEGTVASSMVFATYDNDSHSRSKRNTHVVKRDVKSVECYNCHEKGHYSRNCPARKRRPSESVNHVEEFMFMITNGDNEVSVDEVNNCKPQVVLMLDTGATVHVYSDEELVVNVRQVAGDVFDTAAGSFEVKNKAKCRITGHDVYYMPEGKVNILSFAMLRDAGLKMEYESAYDEFHVTMNGLKLVFERCGKLYKHVVNDDTFQKLYGVYPDNVLHDEVSLNKQELIKLKRTSTAMHNANISAHQLSEVIRTNVWKDSDEISRADVDKCIQVFGRDPSWERGRARLRHNAALNIPRTIPEIRHVTIYFDLMFLFGQTYFVLVTDKSSGSLLMTRHMKGMGADEVLENLEIAKNMLKTRKWEIIVAYSDSQSGVSKELLSTIGIVGEQLPAKTKVGEVEVQIRLLKERMRSMLSNLKYTLPLNWVKYLVTAATIQLNCMPKIIDGVWSTARETYYGVKPSLLDIEKLCFGDYIEVTKTDNVNDVEMRTRPGIALYPLLDDKKTWCVMTLDKMSDVKTRSYGTGKLQMTDDVVRRINDYGRNSKTIGGAITADQILLYTEFSKEVEREMFEMKIEGDDIFDIAQCFHISYKRGLQLYGEAEVIASVKKEIFDLIDQEVWLPVDYWLKADAASFLFLKDKLDKLTGKRIKLKCRHVISQLDSEDSYGFYDDIETRSPTPSWNVTTLLFAELAEKGYFSKVMDVPAAFLWAANPYGHIVILDEVTTKFALERKPEWAVFVRNGKMKVKLVRNQYGTKEAGRLWHELISKFLLEAGYAQNVLEPCLFVKQHGENQCGKTTILVYVDDLLVISSREEEVDSVQKLLTNRFGTGLVVSQLDEYDYLGLRISHDRDGRSICLSGDKYVEETLNSIAGSELDSSKTYQSPSSSDLFTLNEQSEALTPKEKGDFHSLVAKLMWIAMRVRLDILLPVCYLATKVHSPRKHELGKLRRVIGYLKFKPQVRLIVKGNDLFGESGTLNVWVDAAHAVHKPSMKSHIGVFASAGKGPILLKSIGAKRQTNSSTGSEMYALSFAVGLICGLVNFMKSYGVDIKRIVIHEDNQAVLNLVQGDKPMNDSSKHMEVQRLFVKERIKEHGMTIQYCKTTDMIADVLTKALCGATFGTLILMMGISDKESEHAIKKRRV